MAKPDFTTKTDEELKKAIKTATLITGMLAGTLIGLILLNIFVNKKNFWGIIAVPLCLSPILLLNFNNIKEMKKELKTRV